MGLFFFLRRGEHLLRSFLGWGAERVPAASLSEGRIGPAHLCRSVRLLPLT